MSSTAWAAGSISFSQPVEKKLGWATTGRLASRMGALKIEQQGPQNYAPTRAQINERFKQAFGYDLP